MEHDFKRGDAVGDGDGLRFFFPIVGAAREFRVDLTDHEPALGVELPEVEHGRRVPTHVVALVGVAEEVGAAGFSRGAKDQLPGGVILVVGQRDDQGRLPVPLLLLVQGEVLGERPGELGEVAVREQVLPGLDHVGADVESTESLRGKRLRSDIHAHQFSGLEAQRHPLRAGRAKPQGEHHSRYHHATDQLPHHGSSRAGPSRPHSLLSTFNSLRSTLFIQRPYSAAYRESAIHREGDAVQEVPRLGEQQNDRAEQLFRIAEPAQRGVVNDRMAPQGQRLIVLLEEEAVVLRGVEKSRRDFVHAECWPRDNPLESAPRASG